MQKNYWKTTLENKDLNHIRSVTREKLNKRLKRVYHLQDLKDVQMVGMKKKVVRLETGKYNGISSMYNFRCDLDLGIRKAACRQIPCACLTCLEMLKNP